MQFVDPDGKIAGPQLDVPLGTSKEQLGTPLEGKSKAKSMKISSAPAQSKSPRLLNQLLENSEEMPYSFHLEDSEITSNLATSFGQTALSTAPRRESRDFGAFCVPQRGLRGQNSLLRDLNHSFKRLAVRRECSKSPTIPWRSSGCAP